jgi:hypothetical protein
MQLRVTDLFDGTDILELINKLIVSILHIKTIIKEGVRSKIIHKTNNLLHLITDFMTTDYFTF